FRAPPSIQSRAVGATSIVFGVLRQPPSSTLFPYTTLFRSRGARTPRRQPRRSAAGSRLPRARRPRRRRRRRRRARPAPRASRHRSEEHTSELQSREKLVCRLLLEKKKGSGSKYAITESERR